MNRNRKLLVSLISLMIIFSFACKKKKEEEVVAPPTPTVVEEPQVLEAEEKPVVHVAEEPTEVDVFDPSRYQLEDVYFDFDKSDLRADTRDALNRYATVLKANPELKVLIEGHCDERGTEDYNLGLGERRANRVREYWLSLGVAETRLNTISYGEMRPKSMGHDEAAWAQNRRAHFLLSR